MQNLDCRITKVALGIALIFASTLIVVACGSTATQPSGTPTMLPSQVQVTLTHAPVGTSDLTWNAMTQALVVKVSMTGLAPNSTHPEHIHSGTCKEMGGIVYQLKPLVANSLGVGTSETTLAGVKGGIPTNMWSINVHNGPGLSPTSQFAPIACADIVHANTSTKSNQSVHVTFGPSPITANESASGMALLSLANDNLTVTLTLTGLAPNSTHLAHIHEGSCEAQGIVVHQLNPVVADASGKGTSTTVIPKVSSIPASGWYVNVHQGATNTPHSSDPNNDLSTQTGFDPIACGNVMG
jgi:hypothetical protein